METVRKEKFSYQSRVAMLRAAVKELLKQCKVGLPAAYLLVHVELYTWECVILSQHLIMSTLLHY